MRTRWTPEGDMALIAPYLPRDSSRQSSAFREAVRALSGRTSDEKQIRLLDLGCGAGDSRREFARAGCRLDWLGLEIPDSPETAVARSRPEDIRVYDGVHVPFSTGAFDVVYSRQVFEHVLFPRELLREVSRILKKGGLFVGSCSALEPFHSRSIFNFTPYGFCMLLRDAGLRGIRVRPGVDGLTLFVRTLLALGGFRVGRRAFEAESPLNRLLEGATRILRFAAERRAAVKLLFCGHFVFEATKDA